MIDNSSKHLMTLQETLYDSANPTRRRLHRTRRDWVCSRVEGLALAGRRRRALEIGPGSGVYLPLLSKLFEEVTASDVELAFLNKAQDIAGSHPNINVVADDITASKLPEGHFDLILCTEVIEHINGTDTVLATLHRLLTPGGALVLTTPQRYSALELTARIALSPLVIGLARLIYREPVEPLGHINLLTTATLQRALDRAALKVVEHDTSGLYLPAIAEWGGKPGDRLQSGVESFIKGGPLNFLLWTQYYVAMRSEDEHHPGGSRP